MLAEQDPERIVQLCTIVNIHHPTLTVSLLQNMNISMRPKLKIPILSIDASMRSTRIFSPNVVLGSDPTIINSE